MQEHIEIDVMKRSGFFPENALGDGPAVWIFQDSRIDALQLKVGKFISNYTGS